MIIVYVFILIKNWIATHETSFCRGRECMNELSFKWNNKNERRHVVIFILLSSFNYPTYESKHNIVCIIYNKSS